MKIDFLDAHVRHWEDAELLWSQARFANADHLYGLSVECGLKRLMIEFGMLVDDSGIPTKEKIHADKIWKRYETYSQGASGSSYPLPLDDPFKDWNVNQRYANRSEIDVKRVESHQKGAKYVGDMITKAKSDGMI